MADVAENIRPLPGLAAFETALKAIRRECDFKLHPKDVSFHTISPKFDQTYIEVKDEKDDFDDLAKTARPAMLTGYAGEGKSTYLVRFLCQLYKWAKQEGRRVSHVVVDALDFEGAYSQPVQTQEEGKALVELIRERTREPLRDHCDSKGDDGALRAWVMERLAMTRERPSAAQPPWRHLLASVRRDLDRAVLASGSDPEKPADACRFLRSGNPAAKLLWAEAVRPAVPSSILIMFLTRQHEPDDPPSGRPLPFDTIYIIYDNMDQLANENQKYFFGTLDQVIDYTQGRGKAILALRQQNADQIATIFSHGNGHLMFTTLAIRPEAVLDPPVAPALWPETSSGPSAQAAGPASAPDGLASREYPMRGLVVRVPRPTALREGAVLRRRVQLAVEAVAAAHGPASSEHQAAQHLNEWTEDLTSSFATGQVFDLANRNLRDFFELHQAVLRVASTHRQQELVGLTSLEDARPLNASNLRDPRRKERRAILVDTLYAWLQGADGPTHLQQGKPFDLYSLPEAWFGAYPRTEAGCFEDHLIAALLHNGTLGGEPLPPPSARHGAGRPQGRQEGQAERRVFTAAQIAQELNGLWYFRAEDVQAALARLRGDRRSPASVLDLRGPAPRNYTSLPVQPEDEAWIMPRGEAMVKDVPYKFVHIAQGISRISMGPHKFYAPTVTMAVSAPLVLSFVRELMKVHLNGFLAVRRARAGESGEDRKRWYLRRFGVPLANGKLGFQVEVVLQHVANYLQGNRYLARLNDLRDAFDLGIKIVTARPSDKGPLDKPLVLPRREWDLLHGRERPDILDYLSAADAKRLETRLHPPVGYGGAVA